MNYSFKCESLITLFINIVIDKQLFKAIKWKGKFNNSLQLTMMLKFDVRIILMCFNVIACHVELFKLV